MAVLGIIAEYNPFHNGHLYLIQEAKKRHNFAAIICVMSGNFLQRGEPSICHKWARAEMALRCGVDLVIELPFCFAVRSAYYFARGAIKLLDSTGVVSHLAFGTESDNLRTLQSLASILACEPEEYQQLLKSYLAQGLSFPLARSQALQEYTGKENLHQLLLGSNNILALEYLRVLEQEGINMIPLPIPRKGSAYHATDISQYASATAIRHHILNGASPENLAMTMPPESRQILSREITLGRSPVTIGFLEQAILAKIRTTPISHLAQVYEVSEGLEFRINQAANACGTLADLKQYVKSKRYNLTKINRILLYLFWGLSKNQIEIFDFYGPQYLHILGFSAKGQKILQQIKNKSQLELINRGSDVKKTLHRRKNPIMSDMIRLDISATDVYTLLFPDCGSRKGGWDFTTSPIIV